MCSVRIPLREFPDNVAPVDIDSKQSLTATIDVITPIYGGGAQAGKSDDRDIIRVPTIRGRLRFWWRATIGAKYQSIEEMRQREFEIWGGTQKEKPNHKKGSHPSNIIIEVDVPQRGNLIDTPGIGTEEGYALFPTRVDKDCQLREKVKFDITIRYCGE